MNTKILVVIVVVVLALVFFLTRDGTGQVEIEESAGEIQDQLGVPAPDGSGTEVDEMIVIEEETSSQTDEGTTDGSSMEEESPPPAEESTEADVEEESSTQVKVTYTSSGFSPRTVTVLQGGTVVWVNESGRNMWVASVVHPTHTFYPEKTASDCLGSSFDACVGIANGESFEFTFNSAGSWKYHNHLSPARTGTVVVE